MNIAIIILMFYWIPAYLYLFVWSVRIRRKRKLTSMQELGEVLTYTVTCFIGIFIVFVISPKDIKNRKLP